VGADSDCTGGTYGNESPFTIVLAIGASCFLNTVDNYWLGPDWLPPISDTRLSATCKARRLFMTSFCSTGPRLRRSS
jgi:hypothetical protein